MQQIKLEWQDPLNFAQKIADNYLDEDWIFLYSGLNDEIADSFSYITLFPKEKLVTNSFLDAKEVVKNDKNRWFGYFAYELANDFEKVPGTKNSFINLPKIYLLNFALIFKFDHQNQILEAEFDDKKLLDEVLQYKTKETSTKTIKVKNIDSNFSDQSYLTAISDIKKMIAAGDFYQTNLTRKFFGKLEEKQNRKENFQTFLELVKLSPANYSSFLQLGKSSVISSSPELFLSVKNGKIISRPIKGTVARGTDEKSDIENKNHLKNSEKEKAENLMIVDLMRNDLSRICEAGSIEVKNLFDISSYKTLHHMSSEIHGEILPETKIFDILECCFPAGSMTGTPKIKAMEVAAKKEKLNRGIYSGSIGYFDNDKMESNLSVVIRTLIIDEDKFEFQVGGAITFDSDENLELAEIFTKAKAITKLLGITHSQ